MSHAARGALVESLRDLKTYFVPSDFVMRAIDHDLGHSHQMRTGLIYESQLKKLQAYQFEAARIARNHDLSLVPARLEAPISNSEAAQYCDRLIAFCEQLRFDSSSECVITAIQECPEATDTGVSPTEVDASSAGSEPSEGDERTTDNLDRKSFVFARDGNGFFIRAFEVEGHFPDLAGFRDLDKLLRSPGERVQMLDLTEPTDRPAVADTDTSEYGLQSVRGTAQPACDEDYLADLKKTIARVRQEKNEAEEAKNIVEMEDSQRQLDNLLTHYSALTGIGGKSRDLNDLANKIRPKIIGRIKTALQKLRDAKPSSLAALADHLESPTVRAEGMTFIYDPRPPVPNWDFSTVRR